MSKLKYIGNGTALPGIPARDLSDDEVKRHGGTRFLVSTGLYEYIKKPPKQAAEEDKWDPLVSENLEKSS